MFRCLQKQPLSTNYEWLCHAVTSFSRCFVYSSWTLSLMAKVQPPEIKILHTRLTCGNRILIYCMVGDLCHPQCSLIAGTESVEPCERSLLFPHATLAALALSPTTGKNDGGTTWKEKKAWEGPLATPLHCSKPHGIQGVLKGNNNGVLVIMLRGQPTKAHCYAPAQLISSG